MDRGCKKDNNGCDIEEWKMDLHRTIPNKIEIECFAQKNPWLFFLIIYKSNANR